MPHPTALGSLPGGVVAPDPRRVDWPSMRRVAKQIEGTLTPQERGVVKYQRGNLRLGATHNGKPMTALTVGPRIMSGTHKGKYASVPSFVPGHNNNKPMTEGQALRYWQKDIEAGRWPIYNSGEELDARSKEIHTIMDVDVEDYVPPSLRTMPR